MHEDPGIKINFFSRPELESPTLVCGFPGSGYVGKLAVDYLLSKFETNHFADIVCKYFPPHVIIKKDGTVRLPKLSLYSVTSQNHNIVILTSDSQPSTPQGEYILGDSIVSLCKQIGVTQIFTLAAYITGDFSKTSKVYGVGTSKKIIQMMSSKGISILDHGEIVGMNGVLIGISKINSLEAACLLGETSGYVIDPNASKSVLECFSKITGIQIDMTSLEQQSEEIQRLVDDLKSQMCSQDKSGKSIPFKSDNSNLGYIS